MIEQQQLEQAIIAQESLRGMVDDTIIDASITALRKQLAELEYFSLDERRKQVTVVFADLAGFTAMSERMDPEEVRAIQQSYFSAVTPAIKKFGGAIEKYIGDAVLAVFGLPQARENDPENAIRAALEMQAALGELNNDLNSQRGIKLAMRIGVNTGMVLATVGQGENNFF
ncbi:MAG: adenylate/guanylate cyclase domain-containing protein [Anaerolineales bacterium]|nr:adenylate/guanylate cyclase domain-containing protein [Anaerolineales bacterium]